MDLIYMDKSKKEVGVLNDFELDYAFGKDENTFSITIDLESHCMKQGYFIAVDGTEYFGIVDTIIPNTNNNTVTYEGRTIHGIMSKKIIKPNDGDDYYISEQQPNIILMLWVRYFRLTDIIEVSEEEQDVIYYQYERFDNLYDSMRKMLLANKMKLRIQYDGAIKKVRIGCVPLYDYSIDEEWDSSQLSFEISRNYRPTNHLVCLGGGQLAERHVISLFVDENGGLQEYTYNDNPMSDFDYITDESRKVMEDLDEVAEVYDYPNAEETINYVKVEELDYFAHGEWQDNYTKFYIKNDDGDFELLEKQYDYVYTMLDSKPSDWSKNYAKYYTKSGSKYDSVNAATKTTYTKIPSIPKNWKKNYSKFYFFYSDGIITEYRKLQGITKYKFLTQTRKPTDWSTDYKNYYEYAPIYRYKYLKKEKQANGTWKESFEYKTSKVKDRETKSLVYKFVKKETVKYDYLKISSDIAPSWKKKKFYTRTSYTVRPEFIVNLYYKKVETPTAPEFKANTYYSRAKEEIIPAFNSNDYYEMKIDHYADLVENAIKKLQKSYNCDTIDITLEPEMEYDINDIVGATESVTGISVFQPITKKIIRVRKGKEEIEYKVGE